MSFKDDILTAAEAMEKIGPLPDFSDDVVYIKMPDGTYAVCSKRFIKDWEDAKDE